MRWELLLLFALFLALAGLSTANIRMAWKRRAAPGAIPFLLLNLAAALWMLTSILEKLTLIPQTKILLSKIQYLGIVSAPLFWLLFVLAYTRKDYWLTRRARLALWIIPVLTLLLVWSNETHGLVWSEVIPATQFGAPSVYRHGAWFQVSAIYSYLLLGLGALGLVWAILRYPAIYSQQALAILAGISLPILANLVYLFNPGPRPAFDLTPLALILCAAIYSWSIFRRQLFDLVPIARDAIFDHMLDGILILDESSRIVDLNHAAQQMLQLRRESAIGQPTRQALAGWDGLNEVCCDPLPGALQTRRVTSHGLEIELRLAPLSDRRGQVFGQLVILRDVSREQQAEESLARANLEKLRLAEAEAIAQERNRIAQEIHDSLAQNLAALLLRIRRWRRAYLTNHPDQMRIELDEGLELVNASLVEARRSIFALRPLPLEEYGLVAALRELAQGFSEYYPVQTIFEVEGAERQLPRALEMTLFRVAQEALNNVVKHAQADTAWIHLDLRPVDAILLFVGDNGSGFDPAALAGQAQSLHFGLSGMRQRVKQANGHLLICSQPGEGSEISVILPIQDDQP